MSAPPLRADRCPALSTRVEEVVCPLCGCRFHGGADEVCGGCPLFRGCHLVHCPNCGYQYPRTSELLEWVRRTLSHWRPS